jgi:hypothetical protein
MIHWQLGIWLVHSMLEANDRTLRLQPSFYVNRSSFE